MMFDTWMAMLHNKLKGIENKTDSLKEEVATSNQGVLDLIGTSGDSGSSTVMGKGNQIIDSMKNVMPLYRADDYLINQIKNTFVILNNEEKTVDYNSPIKLGTIVIPENCYKIIIKGNLKGSSIQINLGNSSNKCIYSSNYLQKISSDTYTYTEVVLQSQNKYSQAQYDVYFYLGSKGTGYCNNLQIEVCTLERVTTETLYPANTIKSYGEGSSSMYFEQYPRLDRMQIIPYSSGFSDYNISIVLFDEIPYVHTPSTSCTYRILY